jgi:phosphate acetyltransferase
MAQSELHNFTFDELQVGQSASLSRVLTKKDIELFAFVSGDVNPAHLDKEFATASVFHDVIGHGMWSGALISTVLGTICPGPGTIYLGQEMKFKKPVHIGDNVTVKLTVKSKHDTKPIVVFDCVCTNEKGETVVEGTATVLAPTQRISVPRPDLPDVIVYEKDHYKDILARFKHLGTIKTAVVHPVESNVIQAVSEAAAEKLIDPVLIGPKKRILEAAKSCDIKINKWPIIDTEHSHAAAEKAVELAARGDVEAIMKGSLHTDELLEAVVQPGSGLRTEHRISHAYVMSIPTYHKPLFITDAAINIAPTLMDKVDICQNAINFWHSIFGKDKFPKVALLSAVETVTVRILSTLDAASLCKMADRGQITGAILDGPLAFDNAISKQAARDKGIKSEVAGDADILVVPDIVAGNILAKQLTFLGHADAAGIVLGARVPIILTSRADTLRTRLLSCVAAMVLAKARQKGELK